MNIIIIIITIIVVVVVIIIIITIIIIIKYIYKKTGREKTERGKKHYRDIFEA